MAGPSLAACGPLACVLLAWCFCVRALNGSAATSELTFPRSSGFAVV